MITHAYDPVPTTIIINQAKPTIHLDTFKIPCLYIFIYIRDGTIIRKIGTMNPTATEMNFIISEAKPIAINAGIRLIIALINILSVSDGS